MQRKWSKRRFNKGDIFENENGYQRKIHAVYKDYLGDIGRTGYWYLDEFTEYPHLCSQEHLATWGKKIINEESKNISVSDIQ